MKIAILSPIAWRTPPRMYGPWEQVASSITEGLLARGMEVTLFATGDSITNGKLESVSKSGYAEDSNLDPKVLECLHISHLMEQAERFDIIHNHFDFLPLSFSRLIETPLITTIHGFSSPKILPVFRKYNESTTYISISNSDRHPDLDYLKTIYHGINPRDFTFSEKKEEYLLFFGRIHPEKGAHDAIEIAKQTGYPIKLAGLIQDQEYFNKEIYPHIDNEQVLYLGNAEPTLRNKLLGGAKALLHPIFFEEPFGLSVVEAMMCGTPVVAYSRGSMPELIADGRTGFLVKGMEEAVESIKKLDQINHLACRNFAIQHFGLERMVEEYLSAYEVVIER
jgi:glycosyltransferase involved in cell wall biosynthesis